MNKIERLEELREKLNVSIEGKENYPSDYSSIIISNHNCLKDIFYLPLAFENEIVSAISSRLIYKRSQDRKLLVDTYLNSFPIEAHGGSSYSNLCLKNISDIVKSGISINIFPEGAYINDKSSVYKGRTGASRILFKSIEGGYYPFFVPVCIDIKSSSDDLDDYTIGNDIIFIKILKPIDYSDELYDYLHSKSVEEKNKILHRLTDKGMVKISEALNRKYKDEYIELFKKGNVIFSDGQIINADLAQQKEYLDKYSEELEIRKLALINDFYS